MSGPKGGIKTPIEQGVIAQAISGFKNMISNAWFGPLEPLKPIVPEQMKESVVGRQWDYPVGFNKQVTPRSNEAINFPQLRALADNCDVLRLVIETRKDQINKLKWNIRNIDDKKADVDDPRIKDVQAFLKFPDKEHDWDTWLRMILEDLFVIDAPTVYVHRTNGGKIYSIDPVDGATIKRVLTEQGRTPVPPLVAYQQILKGIPAVDYTTDEIIYKPRNPRTNKVYGYSPVEQIIMTVNIALRRSIHKLQYYTEGNIPEMIIAAPETWNPDQIAKMQLYWDSLHEGNTAERRHAKFVPGGMKPYATKEDVMKDAFDEWLARVVCFAFSIEPTAFIHQQNRATAETSREAALSEGLAPIMQWVSNFITFIIVTKFGYSDLEFAWVDEEVHDPSAQAEIDKIYIECGVLLPGEVRTELGRDPYTPEQLEEIAAAKAPPPPTVSGADEQLNEASGGAQPPPKVKAPPKTVGKSAKKAKRGPVIDQDRPRVKKLQGQLKATVSKFLKAQAPKIIAQISKKFGKIEKAKAKTDAEQIAAELELNWDELVPDVSVILGGIAKDGAQEAFDAVGVDGDVDGPATAWAQDRAAELVGRKWVDGELVDNPNAEWAITDSTREMIQSFVAQGIDDGSTMDELSDQLQENFAFSEDRADMIARTETRMADSNSQMMAYDESGVVQGTEWTTAEDDAVSDDCVMNAEAGVIPLGEIYPSGDEAPPAHPNCRCAIVAVLIGD